MLTLSSGQLIEWARRELKLFGISNQNVKWLICHLRKTGLFYSILLYMYLKWNEFARFCLTQWICNVIACGVANARVCVCEWNWTNLFVVIGILFIQWLSCKVVVALFATIRVLFNARQHCCSFLLRILHFGHDLWLVWWIDLSRKREKKKNVNFNCSTTYHSVQLGAGQFICILI